RDVSFWLGEALGRVGQHERAIKELNQFVQGGPHPLLEAGWARLGWWSLAAERYPESVTAFRAYLASPKSGGPERPWVEAGLAHAVRAGAAHGTDQRHRLVRGVSPGPDQLRAARVRPGCTRPRRRRLRRHGARRAHRRADAARRGRVLCG